jgi:hypothetical protein
MYIFVIIYHNKYIKMIKVTIFLVGVKGLNNYNHNFIIIFYSKI